uniref:SAM domain-containing protein n=1 Tax=Eptatretus burgeri TaxID=7764 RepID=A0A8C4N6K3_EPTBU
MQHRISQASSREDDEGTPADNGAGSATEQTICDSASDEEVFRPLNLEPSQLSIQYQEVCTSEREWQALDGERSLLSAVLLEERSIAEDLHSHDEEAQEECQKLNQLRQEALAVKEDLGHRYQQLLTLLPQEAHGTRADLLKVDGVEGQEFNNCEKQQQQHESKMPVMNVTDSATVEQSSLDQLCGGGSTHHEICSANVIESPKVVDDLFFGLIPQMMILDSSIQKAKRQLLGKNKRRKPSRTHSPLVMKQMLKASKEKNIVARTGAMPKTKSSPPAQEIEMTTEEPSVESVQPSPRSALSAERCALPAERCALPAERCALPAEISALPAERSALPAERSALPAERSALPAERSALPAERSALPAERSALPAERSALPAERSALPAERSALPAERSALPAERSALPAERSALPAERSALPAERSALPAERSALPAERSALPAERSALPAERSDLPAERSALPAARERLSFGKGTLKFFRSPLRQSLGKGKKSNVHVSSSNKESQDSTRNVSDWARERNGPRSNALSACMPWSRRNSDGGVDSDNGLSDGPLPRAGRPQTSLATGQISEAGRGEGQLYGMITEPNTSGYSHTFIVNNEVGRGYMEGLSPTRPHHWQNRAIHEWGPEQVNQWLLVLGLEQYAESFSLHDVHGDQLLQLDGSKLKALGVLDAEDRALIKRRLKDLRTALMKERKVQVKLERQRAKEHDLNKLATSDGSQDTMI